MIKTCTVASDDTLGKVLCVAWCGDLGVDANSIVDSSKENKSGIASIGSRIDTVHMYDDCEEAHICSFANR